MYTSFSQVQEEPHYASGIEASRRDIAARAARDYALEQMVMENQQKQANLQRYQAMTPLELDKTGWEAAQARAQMPYADDYAMGQRGTWQQNRAKGALAMGTLDSDIAAGNSKNNVSTAEGIGRYFDIHEPMMKVGGLEGQAAYAKFVQGLPPQARELFPRSYDPSVHERMAIVRKAIQNSPEHRRKLEQDKQAQDAADVNNKRTNDTSIINNRYTVDGRLEAAYAKMGLSGGDVKKLEHMITQYLLKGARGEATTPQEDKAYMAAQQIMNNARGAGADPTMFKYNFMNTPPGLQPPMPARPVPGPVPPPGAQPQQTEDERYKAWKQKNGLPN
jgi:hypothetical protein